MLAKTKALMDDDAKRDRVLDAIVHTPLATVLPEGAKGRWYIVTTLPNHENIAASHLIARRFGLYQPRKPSSYVVKGRKRSVMRNLAPGYLFVLVWDIERDFRRILAVPGVNGIIDRPIPDREVNRLRAAENSERPLVYVDDVVKVRKRRKKYTQVTRREEVSVDQDEIVSVACYDAWAEIAALAEPKGIGKLHTALGLDAS